MENLDQEMGNPSNAPVMTVKDWMITMLITFLPLVGFIMLFVWAFGSNENPNKSNFAKAALIWTAISFVLLIIFYGALAALFLGASSDNFDA